MSMDRRFFVSETKSCRSKIIIRQNGRVRSRYNIPIEKGLGVFNGDMGLVREINTFSETLTVEYEEEKDGGVSV